MKNWSGCWEKRESGYICRWMIAWDAVSDCEYSGAIGGYSGGGSFQLERFALFDQEVYLEADEKYYDQVAEGLRFEADNCQDFILDYHKKGDWEDWETLRIVEEKIDTMQVNGDLIYGGGEVPEILLPVFASAGLTSAPKS